MESFSRNARPELRFNRVWSVCEEVPFGSVSTSSTGFRGDYKEREDAERERLPGFSRRKASRCS